MRGGTYVCIEGPQFSTYAESMTYKGLGYSVIGMTNLPEAKLAREAEISLRHCRHGHRFRLLASRPRCRDCEGYHRGAHGECRKGKGACCAVWPGTSRPSMSLALSARTARSIRL